MPHHDPRRVDMTDTNARSRQISLTVLTKRKLQVRRGKSKSHVSHVTKDVPKNPEAGRSGGVSPPRLLQTAVLQRNMNHRLAGSFLAIPTISECFDHILHLIAYTVWPKPSCPQLSLSRTGAGSQDGGTTRQTPLRIQRTPLTVRNRSLQPQILKPDRQNPVASDILLSPTPGPDLDD